jgi:LuxR family maltose regulon positive regulatory protein
VYNLCMASPILVTKLFIPTARSKLVSRARLIERLTGGLNQKLTLISAPAGFGKTTLVAEWLNSLGKEESQEDYRIAWLSLDDGDNDLTRFLTYFVTALNQVIGSESAFGKGILSTLQTSQLPPTESTLTSLINEIAAIPNSIILVLDDYHLIDSQTIHEALTFLLENLPPTINLVIATREDPLLPLSRLRVRGQLTEIRAVDLRFSSTEAAEFLNQVMGLELSSEDITALESRTEGWIAGLQLAAISMQGRTDVSGFVKSFTGSHKLVLDYLIEEVLGQQPESIQNFLLQTSILNQLTGSLCDFLTGQDNGQQVLETLERANLFIIPLDDDRGWYRYHQLFADLLRQRLELAYQNQIPELHRRASDWYEQNGVWPDAVRHAFASEDLGRAADLIELAWDPMNTSYQSVAWLDWTKALPDEMVRSRPQLSTSCGWASLDAGDLDAAELHFRNAERLLNSMVSLDEPLNVSSDRKAEFDDEQFRSLSISIANGRAYLAQALGDVNGTVKYAQWASELLRENEYFERGLSEILPGFAYWSNGELEAAYKAISEAISKMQMAGRFPFVISFTSYLTDVMVAQGRLQEAERTYLQLLEAVKERGKPELQEVAVLHLGLSELFFERGNIETAKEHLKISEKLGERPAFPPWYRHWICAHIRFMRTEGDYDGALEMLSEAEGLYYRHPIPDVRPLSALIARMWLAQGKLDEVLHWVDERNLSIDENLSYLREFEHITFARLLIARYREEQNITYIQDAMELLERLLSAAEEGGRMGSVVEILMLQSLAFEAQDDIQRALPPLKRVLRLAEPKGYFRIFVDEGPPMAHLLYEALSRGIAPDYVQRLLKAFPVEEPEEADISQPHGPDSELIEPLSEREIEVLQLIADGLTNQEISTRLYLSLNTVKAHTRNIYGKLGVNSRIQASARARALGLISSS